MTERLGWARRLSAAALLAHAGVASAQAPPVARDPPPSEPAPKPKVVMPQLEHFESAPYPADARQRGLEGNVVLELVVEADGSVSAASVLEPAGHGFDEAARAAALKFRFRPASVGGQPARVKIRYRYRFQLQEEAPPEGPDEPEPAPPPGALEGRLEVAGTPLAGIAVSVRTPSGQQLEAISDERGGFSFSELAPGSYRLRINAPGFEPLRSVERVDAGEATVLRLQLKPRAERGGIEVTVEGERPPREVTKRRLSRREIARVPGTGGDALRSIESLPGVARPPAIAGILILRGSAPQDSEAFFDGASVPLIYHFGGLRSVVPSEMIDTIDFYPANFSVRYGRRMGGIVDVGLRVPDTTCRRWGEPTGEDGCYHGLAELDLIDGRVMAQGPLGPLDDWTFAAGVRRSWLDAWITPVLEEAGAAVTSAPVYYDWQAIAETKPGKDSRLSLRWYGANDRIRLIVNDPVEQEPALAGGASFSTTFWRAQALYEAKLAPDVSLEAMGSIGPQNTDATVGPFRLEIDSLLGNFRSELSWRAASNLTINGGLDFLVAPFEYTARFPPPPRPGEPSAGPFSTRQALSGGDDDIAWRPAWYVDAEWNPVPRLRLVPGVRIDYTRSNGDTNVSPRFSARYALIGPEPGESDEPIQRFRPRTTLKGGAGLYHQPPLFQETDPVFGSPGLENNRALHTSLGVEQTLSRYVSLSVEGYYKKLDQLVSRTANFSGNFDYDNRGTGYVVGMETLLRHDPGERFFGWIAYTLSRSVRRNAPGEQQYPFAFDQTHNLTMLGSYRLGGGWEAGARFRVISGPLVTPVLGRPGLPAVYAADAGAYTQLTGDPFSERLPLFHQLDIRIDKRWQFETWRLGVFLDIQNTYNHTAKETIVYNYNYTQSAFQEGLPILPSLGARGEF